jgi:sarcosine oxidase subunit beta
VVNAGGPWAIEIGRWVGVDIPIDNRARTVIVTEPIPELAPGRPFIEDLTAEWYYRPEGPSILMGMGKEPVDRMQVQPTYEMLDRMTRVACHRVPLLETARVQTTWAGVRPLTCDDRPILGPVDSLEGFFLNCGWGGMGIIQAPIAGQLVAEFVSDGHTTTMDIEPFGITRFCEQRQSRP